MLFCFKLGFSKFEIAKKKEIKKGQEAEKYSR